MLTLKPEKDITKKIASQQGNIKTFSDRQKLKH